MARMKRVMNRYGKVTLASLGGCLVTLGTFFIVLASLTVTNVARADEECFMSSFPVPGYDCTCVTNRAWMNVSVALPEDSAQRSVGAA